MLSADGRFGPGIGPGGGVLGGIVVREAVVESERTWIGVKRNLVPVENEPTKDRVSRVPRSFRSSLRTDVDKY